MKPHAGAYAERSCGAWGERRRPRICLAERLLILEVVNSGIIEGEGKVHLSSLSLVERVRHFTDFDMFQKQQCRVRTTEKRNPVMIGRGSLMRQKQIGMHIIKKYNCTGLCANAILHTSLLQSRNLKVRFPNLN